MLWGAVYVRRQDVGLHAIALHCSPVGAAQNRIQQPKQPFGPIPVALLCQGPGQPNRCVGVLAAILSDSRRIGLDVAGVVPFGIEGWREQSDDSFFLVDEMLERGFESSPRLVL